MPTRSLTAAEQLTGPAYAYTLTLNYSLTSLSVDAGYRPHYGRLSPFAYVGAGLGYLSSSQLDGQQAGQAQHLGVSGGLAPTLRAGAGLEYRLYHPGLAPYVELLAQVRPGQEVGGEHLAFLLPLVGVKFFL